MGGLSRKENICPRGMCVLILVLVEDVGGHLKQRMTYTTRDYCLNPCFGGRCGGTGAVASAGIPEHPSLNPCFGGRCGGTGRGMRDMQSKDES